MRCSCSGFVIGRVCCMLRLSPAQHLSVARSSSRENYLPGWKALNRKTTSTHQLSFDSFLLVYFYFIFFFFLYRLATCCMVVLFGYNSSTDFLLLLCVEKVFSLGWKTRKNKPSKKREWRRNWKLLFLFAGKWETYKKARAPTSELIDRHHSHGAPHLVWRGGNPKCNSIFLLNRF